MNTKRWLTVHFVDGSEMKFDFPEQEYALEDMAAFVEKFMESKQLVLEVEGVMYMFPYNNIKYVRVSPCPIILPETAVRGVQLSST